MGVTWHGCYLRYFETARSALLNRIGYNFRQMTASGLRVADRRSQGQIRQDDDVRSAARRARRARGVRESPQDRLHDYGQRVAARS